METSCKIPTVAIVGRPNVGKSSLFNAMAGRRISIVHEECGVTRDRIVAPVQYSGRRFQIIDTGGLGLFHDNQNASVPWDDEIREQIEAALADADLIVFVVEAQSGLLPLDSSIAQKLHESGKEVIQAVNKVDNPSLEKNAMEFAVLGFGEIYSVSCTHRQGIADLMDKIVAVIAKSSGEETPRSQPPFPIAVVGRPNVGKSSIVNRLLGEKRVIVSEVAGTTRDSIDVPFSLEFRDEQIPAILIDTAGLRKRARINSAVEIFSVMRAEESIERAKLILFVVEARPDGLTAQDRHIARMIVDSGKACVVVANKWDVCGSFKQKDILDEIYHTLPLMTYAPVVFTCALSGYNFGKMLDSVAEVMGQMDVHITTSVLNKVISDAVTANAAPYVGTKQLKIYYATMVKNAPPTFALFVNSPKYAAHNYMVYLVNFMRKRFAFAGLPVKLELREKVKRAFVPPPSRYEQQKAKKRNARPFAKKAASPETKKATRPAGKKAAPKAKSKVARPRKKS